MQLLIEVNLVPTKSNVDLFNKADISSLIGDKLLLLWNSTDVRILNLEVPLTDKKNYIDKC